MRWRNYLYHRYIMAHLKRNCTAPGAELSEAERKAILGAGTLWQFDHEFTAPATAMPTPRTSTTPTRARISSAASIPRRC